MICVLDFKRDVGLWHAILTVRLFFIQPSSIIDWLSLQSVFNGMQVIFVPYSLMKINPASWMLMATRYKGDYAVLIA